MEKSRAGNVRGPRVRHPVLGVLFRESVISGHGNRTGRNVFGPSVSFDIPRRALGIGVPVRLENRFTQSARLGVRLREFPVRRHPAARTGSFGRYVHFAMAGREGVRNVLKPEFAGVFRRALLAARIFPFPQRGTSARTDSRPLFDVRSQRQLERDRGISGISVVPVFRFLENRRRRFGRRRVVLRVLPAFPG